MWLDELPDVMNAYEYLNDAYKRKLKDLHVWRREMQERCKIAVYEEVKKDEVKEDDVTKTSEDSEETGVFACEDDYPSLEEWLRTENDKRKKKAKMDTDDSDDESVPSLVGSDETFGDTESFIIENDLRYLVTVCQCPQGMVFDQCKVIEWLETALSRIERHEHYVHSRPLSIEKAEDHIDDTLENVHDTFIHALLRARHCVEHEISRLAHTSNEFDIAVLSYDPNDPSPKQMDNIRDAIRTPSCIEEGKFADTRKRCALCIEREDSAKNRKDTNQSSEEKMEG